MKTFSSVLMAAAASLMLVGCGGGDGSGNTLVDAILDSVGVGTQGGGTTAAPAPTPAPSAAPVATPSEAPAGPLTPTVGTNMDAGYPQLDAIPTNFSKAGMLTSTPVPAASIEDVGAFRFLCKPSHLSYDDPIVYPGQQGRAHLHMFFGNTEANAFSTYKSLRTTGESTCNNALNRSAYWVPAMMNGQGEVVLPSMISVYYKRLPQSDPLCREGKGCIGLPRGLRYIFGRTMSGDFKGHATDLFFNCDGPGAVPGFYKTLPEAAKVCPNGARIGVVLVAPNCWNGRDLDSADHRSHMAYTEYGASDGKARCPATHPYRIPTFQLGLWYDTDNTLDRSGDLSPTRQTWHFSSDRMAGMAPVTSGMTFHADWFGAWDDETLATWIDTCIEKHLSCSGGDLGNGTMISHSQAFRATLPRLAAIPADPKTTLERTASAPAGQTVVRLDGLARRPTTTSS